ncbi:MAG: hypothetical protein CVU89_12470 [Firmicutes bacterium HGW-Firmicutes-14]|nr:MAG: hypothetical protein CVU89_12470 [Firmicutes bacterium HGW-Firmicutes-14]
MADRMADKKEGVTGFFQKATVRVGSLLAVVLILFAVGRAFAVPDSFGEYGRYRGNNLQENADKEVSFTKGNEVCRDCHNTVFQALTGEYHNSLNCESCHGPAAAHVAAIGAETDETAKPVEIEETVELCSACHAETAGRSKEVIATVQPVKHSGGIDCIRCHNPHQPRTGLGGMRQ